MQVEDKELQNGSGTTVQDINKFINSYEMTKKLMKKMQTSKGGMKSMMKNLDINSLKGMKF
jgi:signal recognition particle GTPase